MLEDFVRRRACATGPQLEAVFANGASLVLARVTTQLRLTYLLGRRLTLHLDAITIFVSAASG